MPKLPTLGLYGAEEMIVKGLNGCQVNRDLASITQWMKDLLNERKNLPRMSILARESVSQYSNKGFSDRWQAIYQKLLMVDEN